MRAFTSISELRQTACCAMLALVACAVSAPRAFAVDGKPDHGVEEDYSDTPYTEYGEFNEEADEAAETKFFQYGRFFGVSVGLGYSGVTGNRALLWQGGFPLIDIKVHYWFDFNMAMDLGFNFSTHSYETTVPSSDHFDVGMNWVGADIKYYFDTKNVAAPIAFANPFILLGVGSFSKSETSANTGSINNDSAFGLTVGGALEFVISPRKSYFQLEGKVNLVTFKDTSTSIYTSAGIEDLSGPFYSITGNFLFTY